MFDDYPEDDYTRDRAQGQLDAWEHAHPGNYAALNQLVSEMMLDLLIQESIHVQYPAPRPN